MISFKGKKVLVTGASSGIGAAIAVEFARRGALLVLAARNEERLREVRERCLVAGSPDVQTASVDMASAESVADFASRMNGEMLDVLVLNAGVSQRSLAFDTSEEVLRKVMETNFFGPVNLVRQLAPSLNGGRPVSIAVTSSITGLFGFPLRTAYSASKHSIIGWFESLGLEYPNIKVTVLIPGRINTPISRSALLGDGTAYAKMDPGQENGMAADKCARVAVNAIARGKHNQLIGRGELIMVYIKKFIPCLFYKLAGKVSAT